MPTILQKRPRELESVATTSFSIQSVANHEVNPSMPINPSLDAEKANPLEDTTPEVRASWELGYHDGIREMSPETGRVALVAFAVGDHERTLKELRDILARDEGQLEQTTRKIEQLEKENEREQKHILPAFGRHSIGIAAWLTIAFYLVLAALAVSAEFPLSRMTVNEAIGTTTTASLSQMNAIRDYAIWAIAVVLCLIGFSLKPLFDVLDRGRGHLRWEIVLVGASLIPCIAAVYGVAQLREAISSPSISITAPGGQQAQGADQTETDGLDEANRAAEEVRKWTAFTFKWVTVGLPLFSAMCLIVSLHQIHNFRGHNRAARTLNQNDDEIAGLHQVAGQLKYAIEHERKRLDIVGEEDPYSSNFQGRSLAAYNHGRATGEAEVAGRLRGLPIYEQLKAKVGVR